MRWKILSLAVAGLLLAPGALAQDTQQDGESDVQITIVAPEQCPDDDAFGDDDQDQNQQDNQNESEYCLELQDGDLEEIEEDDDVELTFENERSEDFNLHVAEMDDADRGGDTDQQDAIASTGNTSQDEMSTVNFTSPVAGDELYFWVDDREDEGMYLTSDDTDDQETRDDGIADDQERDPAQDPDPAGDRDDTPAPGLIGLAVAGVSASLLARRR